jgi:hypothetical protein
MQYYNLKMFTILVELTINLIIAADKIKEEEEELLKWQDVIAVTRSFEGIESW